MSVSGGRRRCRGGGVQVDLPFWAANNQTKHGLGFKRSAYNQHTTCMDDSWPRVDGARLMEASRKNILESNIGLRVPFTTDRHHPFSGLESILKFSRISG